MDVLDKDKIYKVGIRFPDEPMSPWDVIKAIEWAITDHLRRFHSTSMQSGTNRDKETNNTDR